MYACAGCRTNTCTLHAQGTATRLALYRLHPPCLWQGTDLGPILLPPTEHHKIGRSVTILEIPNLFSNLLEAVLYTQKLPGGPQGKQHNYVGSVTLGNQPGAAKGPVNSIPSPTGIWLPKNMVKRHPTCTEQRQQLASKRFAASPACLHLVTLMRNKPLN